MKTNILAVLAIVLITLTNIAWGGPFEDAGDARDLKDYPTALRLYQRLADQGDARAQFWLADMYAGGIGIAKDYLTSIHWYRRSANQGYADAQFVLGLMYEKGRGVPQDFQEAYFWLVLSAAQGGEIAILNRDELEQHLTSVQIAKAQEDARNWKPQVEKH